MTTPVENKNMNVPVVFISKSFGGDNSMLSVSTECASKNNQVFLLGDEGNKSFCKGGEYIPYERYKQGYGEFEQQYIHFSTNHEGIESFCFSRWFILRDFMREYNIEMVFHIDWDALCFINVSQEAKRFSHLDCAISAKTTGGQCFFTLEGINKFCDYILRLYQDKEGLDFQRIYVCHYALRQQRGLDGGVCDMNFFEGYARYEAAHSVGEISLLSHDPSNYYFEVMMTEPEGFETQSKHYSDGLERKVYTFKDGIPYVKHLRTGRLVPFANIHFQGPSKPLLKKFYKLYNDSIISH